LRRNAIKNKMLRQIKPRLQRLMNHPSLGAIRDYHGSGGISPAPYPQSPSSRQGPQRRSVQ
jgi:hypothetical protein